MTIAQVIDEIHRSKCDTKYCPNDMDNDISCDTCVIGIILKALRHELENDNIQTLQKGHYIGGLTKEEIRAMEIGERVLSFLAN